MEFSPPLFGVTLFFSCVAFNRSSPSPVRYNFLKTILSKVKFAGLPRGVPSYGGLPNFPRASLDPSSPNFFFCESFPSVPFFFEVESSLSLFFIRFFLDFPFRYIVCRALPANFPLSTLFLSEIIVVLKMWLTHFLSPRIFSHGAAPTPFLRPLHKMLRELSFEGCLSLRSLCIFFFFWLGPNKRVS